MIGTTLGPYHITQLLGVGGMGEVYLADDLGLKRRVAIKVLPAALAEDPERLARLEREAQLLAQLEHPNVAAVYGLHEADGVRFLVMQFVAGETVADRLLAGPLPAEEALRIALQVAEGLEAAHERGIVHRDLKAANVMVAAGDGDHPSVKLLDFGLAKAVAGHDGDGSIELTASPTMLAATGVGVLMGTAPYMSPEQARGKEVDRRADIWAFGCLLYELFTGVRPFEGETVTDVLAAVVRAEPEWSRLPASVPAEIQQLLMRCLRKDPHRRLQHIGDARVLVQETLDGEIPFEASGAQALGTGPRAGGWRRWILAGGWALAAVLLALLALRGRVPEVATTAPMHLVIDLQGEGRLPLLPAVALSDDGRRIAWILTGDDLQNRLWAREFEDPVPHLLAEGPDVSEPFFSPRGDAVGFIANGALRTVPFEGGLSTALADVSENPRGGSWSESGFIVYAPSTTSGLWRVPETGGPAEQITTLDSVSTIVNSHRWPQVVPGSDQVVYTAGLAGDFTEARIELLELGSGKTTVLFEGGTNGVVTPTGHLLLVSQGTLYAGVLSADHRSLTSAPVPVIESISHSVGSGSGQYALSHTGTLWFGEGGQTFANWQLERAEEDGSHREVLDTTDTYHISLSPDGTKVAEQRGVGGRADIWVRDLERGVAARLTFDDAAEVAPIWTPDGERITFASDREGRIGDLFWQPADGSGAAELLASGSDGRRRQPMGWSPDGKVLVLTELDPDTGDDLYLLRAAADGSFLDSSSEPFVVAAGNQLSARVSPDGNWIAYQSAPNAFNPEIIVESFPDRDQRWQLSDGGGAFPMWRAGGREISFVQASGGNTRVVSVEVKQEGAQLRFGAPRVLFEQPIPVMPGGLRGIDAAVEGDEFLVFTLRGNTSGQSRSVLIFGWLDQLSNRVPTGR